MPREGEGLDIGDGIDPATVESLGYDVHGYQDVFLGRLMLDDLGAAQLHKLGWRVRTLPRVERAADIGLGKKK